MAPTPYKEGLGRYSLHYITAGVPHTWNFPVAVAESGGDWYCQRRDGVGGKSPADLFADCIEDTISPLFDVLDDFVGWTLSRFSSGVFVPLSTGVLTSPGTSPSARVACSGMTATFRDATYKFTKVLLLEVAGAVPASSKHGETWSGLSSFLATIFDQPDDGANLGSFMVSRAGDSIDALVGWALTLNDSVLRQRNFI